MSTFAFSNKFAGRQLLLLAVLFLVLALTESAYAQDGGVSHEIFPADVGYPTIVSVKTGAGWAIGRSRQLYGYNGDAPVYWSTGEGVKLNIALDIPILPIEVVNNDGPEFGPSRIPLVALEFEAATGYNLSTGGTTNDQLANGTLVTTRRVASYIPATVGINARSSFGAGLPSVYVGVGGGVYLVGLYREEISYSGNGGNNLRSGSEFIRKMNPPVPFGLYGTLGIEIPMAYYPEDGNSLFDVYAELRLTEMSAYVYDYDIVGANGARFSQGSQTDGSQLFLRESQRSASSVGLNVGVKVNLY